MELTQRIAQPFVKALEETLPYKVTITDVRGYIIGSSDPSRLNRFHPSAYEIICGRQPIETLEDDTYVNVPKGVILGYGEKIVYKGECIGLIGLIGPPEERKNDIKTAQFILRLLLDREYVQHELNLAMADKNAFLVRLINGIAQGQERWVEDRAKVYGIDLSCPRQVLVIRAKQEFLEKSKELFRDREEAVRIVKAAFSGANDLVYRAETDDIVVLTVPEDTRNPQKWKKLIHSKAKQLHQELNDCIGASVFIGISQVYDRYQDYCSGYKSAQTALDIGERTEPDEEIYFYEEMRLGRIIAGFTPEMCHILQQSIINPLLAEPGGDELIRTLRAYFKNNLSVTKTSEDLYIHRNTLQYRFKKIKQVTGHDILVGDDLIQLRLAILQHQFFN